jgi:hypothetical protein
MRSALRRVIAIAALVTPATVAAEDSSRDRAEFNAVNGIMLSPVATAEAAPATRRPPPRSEPAAAERRQERRTVRVVLPSPYGR